MKNEKPRRGETAGHSVALRGRNNAYGAKDQGKQAIAPLRAGWFYLGNETPTAYLANENDPRDTAFTYCETWWQALSVAMTYEHCVPGCAFVGGPET